MKRALKYAAHLLPDLAVLTGAAAITAGCALLSVAAGCIAGGVLLIVLGIFGRGNGS